MNCQAKRIQVKIRNVWTSWSIHTHINYYYTNNQEYLYFQDSKTVHIWQFSIYVFKRFLTMWIKCHIISVIILFVCMLVYFIYIFLPKWHTNRWLILKVYLIQVNVSLSRWTLGFSANTVPLPYGQDLQQETLCSALYLNTNNVWIIVIHHYLFCGQNLLQYITNFKFTKITVFHQTYWDSVYLE